MLNKELERERLVTCCLEIFVVCSLLFLTTFGLSPLAVAGAFMGSYDKSYLALIIQPKGSKSRENLFKVVIPNIYNEFHALHGCSNPQELISISNLYLTPISLSHCRQLLHVVIVATHQSRGRPAVKRAE